MALPTIEIARSFGLTEAELMALAAATYAATISPGEPLAFDGCEALAAEDPQLLGQSWAR